MVRVQSSCTTPPSEIKHGPKGFRNSGDPWDPVALDPDSRLVPEVVVGPRTPGSAELLLEGVRGRVPELVTSDGDLAHVEALCSAFGEERAPPRTGRPRPVNVT